MTESRLVCCCGAVTWARVIGWTQIILSVLSVFLVILALTGVAMLEPDDKEVDGDLKPLMLALLVLALIFEIAAVGFGLLLIKGTNERRPSFLRAWMVYALFLCGWSIVDAAAGSGKIAERIISCLISLSLYAFGIWIVYTVKEEIEHEDRISRGVN